VVYALEHGLGTIRIAAVEQAPAEFTPGDRALLASGHVRFGREFVYVPDLLTEESIRAREALTDAWFGRLRAQRVPTQLAASFAVDRNADPDRYLALGYAFAGGRAIRIDAFERVLGACMTDGMEATSVDTLANWLAVSTDDAKRLARAIAPNAPRTRGPDDVAVSKRLSYLLRHKPSDAGLALDEHGWIEVDALLQGLARGGLSISRERLERIVAASDKQRFAFSEDRQRIRANQGHSVTVDLAHATATPPAVLYHGTAADRVEAIRREGLRRGRRHDVHLSADIETARRVGARHGKPAVLVVDAAAMVTAGFSFRRSPNGVWLVDHVPPAFVREA
jgi:putative RNA 2'-phosphotransferase